VDERLRFVARLMEGEKMAALCREFDISRKTGYKIFNRYKGSGLEGLTDRSRRPYRQGCQLPFQIENLILQVKRDHPSWGAPKIREKIRRKHSDIRLPAISTVHAVLHRHGLVNVNRRRQRSHKAEGTALSRPVHPNELWCADYKGEFMLADRRYCYPLTITDAASRYLLCCEALHPQQNGRHERMHLTLKREATKPASRNLLQQQERFDRFVHIFNDERPHEALGMKYPTELYVSSSRPYKGLSELEYPFHDRTSTVTNCGRICLGNRKINLSTVFAGQNVGIKEVADQVWLVSFMQYDLGFFDHETGRITSAENPFGAKVLPMCSE